MRQLLLVAMTIGILNLLGVNDMDIVWTVDGEQQNDHFGYSIAALDFNGDGYDDLAVSATGYHVSEEYSNFRGKLYIYWGSENGLSETCDYSITTEVDTTLRNYGNWNDLRNLGDMDGDGCEDLGYRYAYSTVEPQHYFSYFGILLGTTVNDSITDFTRRTGSSTEYYSLGDINGDGCSEVGIIEESGDYVDYTILYGDSFETFPMAERLYNRGYKDFRGLGDINGDGYDDFYYHYTAEPIPQPNGWSLYPFNNCVFYGDAVQDTTTDVRLTEYHTNRSGYLLAPVGDFDGDGYDDFVRTTTYQVDGEYLGIPFWHGGEEIHWSWFSMLECDYYSCEPLHGDLNGDGLSDIVMKGSRFRVLLGGQNGTVDYLRHIGVEDFNPQFSIGDFDGDGCDDIAVGDDGDDGHSNYYDGSAFVFAGNTDLEEEDPQAADEQTVSPVSVEMNAYPNPFNPEICFDIKVPECRSMQLEFFNIRGQIVDSIELNRHASSITWKPENLASGVYMCRLKADGRIVARKKITLMK